MKPFRALTLAAVLALAAAQAWAAGGQSVLSFAREEKATLHYDVLSGTGYLEKGGAIVSFALGIPFAVLDWQRSARVGAPYFSGEELYIPGDLAALAKDYFLQKNQPARERYSVATVLIDPGHGGKDPGAIAEIDGKRLQEKDLTLEVSKRVLDLLKARYYLGRSYWGRTGFDLGDTPEAACRGRSVGLVNHRVKTKLLTKN